MRKYLSYIFLTFIIILTGCSNKNINNTNKIKIIATLFPQYDFARQIVKDKGNVELLITPGKESHSYDLTPSDIIKISKSDLFIYTGKNMENWIQTVIDSLDDGTVKILDVSKNISLYEILHDEDNDEHTHNIEPHIWTSPKNAKIMVQNILEAIIEIDPDNKEFYENNAQNYLNELEKLDKNIKEVVLNAKRNKIYFASRFAFYYFVRDYNLEYVSIFDSCADEAEPSIKDITNLINDIKHNNIPVIYYQELTDTNVAQTIAKETNVRTLQLHSAHNVTKKEFENEITYLEIMYANLENLKVGLN